MKQNHFFKESRLKIKEMFDISFLGSLYKAIIFKDLLRTAFPFILKRYIAATQRQQKKVLLTLKSKQKITVAFFLQSPSVWKYDRLFTTLQQSEQFSPIVVICPFNINLAYDRSESIKVMQQAAQFAQQKGYSYINSYDEQSQRWVDIKKKLNPDIVFFTKPYKDTLPAYYIYNFRKKITCYTSYGFSCINNYRLSYNLPAHNLLYHFFVETEFQKKFAQEYSLVKGKNAIVTGGLGTEQLIDKKYTPKDVWKPQSSSKKRIIWAPHHTVDYLFNFSNFLSYNQLMIDLAKKYEDSIQFAFKPHPVLKFKLINLWGKEKTEEYYHLWETMPNTQLEEGYYNDLFLTSDAMIHDCASFTAEYLHTLKPVMFAVKNEDIVKQWNPFGVMAYNLHYHGHNEAEIEQFIQQVVLNGVDPMLKDRQAFFESYLYPKDGVMPSQKIIQILEEDLKKAE